MNYLQFFLEKNFRRPELITETEGHRVASTLELFVDLAFVGVLATLVHFLVGAKEVNLEVIIGFLLRFFSAFSLWWNLMWYNNLFENESLRHRLLMVLIVITVIGQQVAYNSLTVEGYYFLLFFFSVSRLIEIYMWASASLPKKQPSHALRVSALFYIFGIFIAVILVALTPVLTGYLKPNYYIWGTSITLEFIAPTVLFTYNMKRLVKKGEAPLPPMNHELFKERFGLLFLLVLGEGIVAAIRIFDLFETENTASIVILGSIIVLIAYGLWEAYFDIVHGQSNHYKETRVNHWATMNVIMILGAMLILGTASELIHPHYGKNINILSTLHLLGLGMFNIGLYLAISMRDRNIPGFEEIYCNRERKFAIKLALTMYSIVGVGACLIGLFGILNGVYALYYTMFAILIFIFMKQYVRYSTEK
ncbi:MAG: low temperature requirement protein A [Culicoidibacterales bacterium]